MPKRKADGTGIKAAFARQAERADAAAKTAAWQPVEVGVSGWAAVPDDYLQESSAKFGDYLDKRDQMARLAAAVSSAAARQSGSTDTTDAAADQTKLASWQASAAYCVQQLAMWPGSGVVLQQVQQEALLHILVNNDLHLDPLISAKAYELLLQHLMHHPPVQLLASTDPQQPPVLQCADRNGFCWDVFSHYSKPLLPDAPSPFPMLQQLVSNAAQLVTGGKAGSGSSSSSSRASSSSSSHKGSQGQALLLLYVVQRLQQDLLVRQAAFERYMQLSQSLEDDAQKAEAQTRAATVLQHSLLYRVMENDSVGGDTWRYIQGSNKGRHQLVRDLVLLVSFYGDEAAAVAALAAPAGRGQAPGAAAAAAAAAPAAAADADMTEAAELPAAGRSEKATAAADEVHHADPVCNQELVQAAQVLLLLILQLYSSCEEAGVYGRGGDGRHHMQRLQGGAGQPNARFEVDDVMMAAIGFCGHGVAHAMPHLEHHSCLQALLLALPPVHRTRLLSLMVVAVIYNRVVDPESEGKLAQSDHNLELQALKDYLCDRGRGYAGFRQPSAVYIMESIDARLEWAAKEMFGGKLSFALLMGDLISAAAPTLSSNAPGPDRHSFAAAAGRILAQALDKARDIMAAVMAHYGRCEALTALAAAQQQLSLLGAVDRD